MDIKYIVNDKRLKAKEFIEMANQIWPRNYDEKATKRALSKTINITARDGNKLVGCVRILTDGVYFGTITEILVLPDYQRKGIATAICDQLEQTVQGNITAHASIWRSLF